MSDFRFEGSKAYFDFSSVGDRTNTTYMGEFCVKCVMSPMDHLKADRLYRELIGSINPHLASQDAKNYAFALSQLKQRVLESADFFKNRELDGSHLDSNVLIGIINKAIEAEEEYKEQQDEKTKKIQEMLAKRIKNKDIEPEPEAEEAIGDEEDIPEIDLGDGDE